MRVCFRVDASHDIGSGHVVRCKTLAQHLRSLGLDVRFVCRDLAGNMISSIRRDGFPVTALERDAKGAKTVSDSSPGDESLAHAGLLGTEWMTDANQTIECLRGATDTDLLDLLIVDHYALDARWEAQVRPHTKKVMVIDDLADREHDCDVLLDTNLAPQLGNRYTPLVPPHCALLLGPQYALLQAEYGELKARTPPRLGPVKRMLAFFGGMDSHNATGLALAAFAGLQRDDIVLDVVLGAQSPHAASIRASAQGRANVVLHDSLSSLAPLMLQADLALGAGGVTSWERCCMGLPTLVITVAGNQKEGAAELDRLGLVRWLGDYDQVTVAGLTDTLRKVVDGTADIERWSRRCLSLLDGKGAQLVASILALDGRAPLRCRLARLSDEGLLLRWANDPVVRAVSFTSTRITADGHRQWFYARLRQIERCRMYIAETAGGLPVGQVRFDCTPDGWEVGASLDPVARGHGLAFPVFRAAMAKLVRSENVKGTIVGRVKFDNEPSQRVFERLGFERSDGGDHTVYRLTFEQVEEWNKGSG